MIDDIEAYPLCWPDGYPRCPYREHARFHVRRPVKDRSYTTNQPVPIGEARDGLLYELEQLGAERVILSTDIPVKQDGHLYATRQNPKDPGVAVYFQIEGEPRVICCDRWLRIADNLRALEKTVEAMRGMDRWGASQILQGMFSGFKALPEQGSGTPWWLVLQIERTADGDEIRAAYKRRVMETHPDKGGCAEEFQAVKNALHQGLAARDELTSTPKREK